jgi:hypothetical protein
MTTKRTNLEEAAYRQGTPPMECAYREIAEVTIMRYTAFKRNDQKTVDRLTKHLERINASIMEQINTGRY